MAYVRYMGWNNTNNSKVSSWSDRTKGSDMFWGGASGVPYEYQIQLSNETKEDLWITVPHLADDNYVRNLAYMVKQQLSPGLRVWVEYSNEVWNGGFAQFQYAYNVLQPKYGVTNSELAYGRRSAEIFDIFSSQLNDPKRLVRVVAGQNANSWVLDQALTGHGKWHREGRRCRVSPYFTVDIDKLYQQYLSGKVNLDNVFSDLHSAVDSVIASAGKNEQVAAGRAAFPWSPTKAGSI